MPSSLTVTTGEAASRDGGRRRPSRRLFVAGLGGALLAACVPVDRPPPSAHIASVEDLKKDIAVQRNQGRISYEDAARRQFEIERGSYALTSHELDVWNMAILYARQYDGRQITLEQYRARTAELFAGYGTVR